MSTRKPLTGTQRREIFQAFDKGDQTTQELIAHVTQRVGCDRKTATRYVECLHFIVDRSVHAPIPDHEWRQLCSDSIGTGLDTGDVTRHFVENLARDFWQWRRNREEQGLRSSKAMEIHWHSLEKVADEIRSCLEDPHLDVHPYLGTYLPEPGEGRLWFRGRDWSLVPEEWVQVSTPDFTDERLWNSHLSEFKEHLSGHSFWGHLDALQKKAHQLSILYMNEVAQRGLIDEWRKTICRGFELRHSRTPKLPLPPRVTPGYSESTGRNWLRMFQNNGA